jgi:hypothetical protein
MTQADSVFNTPPANTSRSRRAVLAGIASAAALPIAAAIPTPAAASADPIYAAIERHKALIVPFDAAWKARGHCKDFGTLTEYEKQHVRKLNDAIDAAGLPMERAACELFDTVPTTLAGVVAAIRVIQTCYGNDGEHMPHGRWLYENEDDSKNGRDWLECFLDTIAMAVDEIATREVA